MSEEERDFADDEDQRRPLGLVLLTGLYLFFFLVTASTFGHSFPFMGVIYEGDAAKVLVFLESLATLYFFLGLLKRQLLTWYFLIAFNLLEIVNTIVNLAFISVKDLERYIGRPIDSGDLLNKNLAMALALLLLTQFIYRQKKLFTNRAKYLF